MNFKEIMTQQFNVLHIIVIIRTAISKPKDYLVASLSISQPPTRVASGSPSIFYSLSSF